MMRFLYLPLESGWSRVHDGRGLGSKASHTSQSSFYPALAGCSFLEPSHHAMRKSWMAKRPWWRCSAGIPGGGPSYLSAWTLDLGVYASTMILDLAGFDLEVHGSLCENQDTYPWTLRSHNFWPLSLRVTIWLAGLSGITWSSLGGEVSSMSILRQCSVPGR